METDSPYLTPAPMRGKRNEPGCVVEVAQALAELHGLTLEDVARITTFNVHRLFKMGPEEPQSAIAYPIGEKLYLNITNRCTNSCFFCGILSDATYKGYNLRLGNEPDAAAILEAVGDPTTYQEVIFSGYGEPTLRLDVVKEVSQELRRRGARRIRLVTNGLGSATYGRNILRELHGLIDSVSVSLQAENAEAYEKICKPKEVENPYLSVKEFIRAAKNLFSDVEVTAVHMPGLIDTAATERVVCEELGVQFRKHEYEPAD